MTDRIRIAMIGCGGITKPRIEGFRQNWDKGLKRFELVAVCDLDESRAQQRAQETAAFQGTTPRVYTDYRKLLDAEKLDAVDVQTEHRSHHTIVCESFERGHHVIVAKPLGLTMRSCKVMVEAAKKAGKMLAVAENYRREPGQRAINWALRQGMIGEPRLLVWNDIYERLQPWAWRDFREQAGGGWCLDGGVHFTDLFRYNLGEADTLYAVSRQFEPYRYGKPELRGEPVKVTVEDAVAAVITFKSGAVVQWTFSCMTRGRELRDRFISGSQGCLDWKLGLLRKGKQTPLGELVRQMMSSLDAEAKERLFPCGMTHTFATEIKDFGDALLSGTKFEVDGLEGLKDQAISMALYESSHLSQPVKLAQIESCEVEGWQKDLNQAVGLA